jgi:hypothetical protein
MFRMARATDCTYALMCSHKAGVISHPFDTDISSCGANNPCRIPGSQLSGLSVGAKASLAKCIMMINTAWKQYNDNHFFRQIYTLCNAIFTTSRLNNQSLTPTTTVRIKDSDHISKQGYHTHESQSERACRARVKWGSEILLLCRCCTVGSKQSI